MVQSINVVIIERLNGKVKELMHNTSQYDIDIRDRIKKKSGREFLQIIKKYLQ